VFLINGGGCHLSSNTCHLNMEKEVKIKRRIFVIKDLFSYRWILNNLVFFLFVAFLAVLYIANGHAADKMIRDINATTKNIKDLKFEFKTLKSQEISHSRQAEIVQAAASQGLKLPVQPPVHITAETAK